MAISKELKVKVIFDSKNENFKQVLPIGFETLLYVNVTDKEQVIPAKDIYDWGRIEKLPDGSRGYKLVMHLPEQKIPAGNFTGFTFKGANGETYAEQWIYHNVGPKPISEIFEKLQ